MMAAAQPQQTLLIAENNPALLTTLTEYIQRNGFKVETAPSLEEAKRKAQGEDIDIILTDLRLTHDNLKSDTSGLEVAMEAHPDVPVIVMSDFEPSHEFVQEVLVARDKEKARVVYFINKEDGFEEILKFIRKYSRSKADANKASAATAGEGINRDKAESPAEESSKTGAKAIGGERVVAAPTEPKGTGEAKTESDVGGVGIKASMAVEESFFSWWKRKSPVFALILLLAALGMGILAMIFQDLLWLFGTVVAAILVVAVIGTAIE